LFFWVEKNNSTSVCENAREGLAEADVGGVEKTGRKVPWKERKNQGNHTHSKTRGGRERTGKILKNGIRNGRITLIFGENSRGQRGIKKEKKKKQREKKQGGNVSVGGGDRNFSRWWGKRHLLKREQ